MSALGRTLTVTLLGDTASLERAFERAGIVVDEANQKIIKSSADAGKAAAAQAREFGGAADEQAAAAGRAAAAYTESSAKISRAQQAASAAAAKAAKAAGASADAQVEAAGRAAEAQKMVEAVAEKSAAAQEAAASRVEAAQKRIAGAGKFVLGAGALTAVFSVKGAVDLQKQMEMIHTQAGASQAQVNLLTKSVINMAPSVATGPGALAQGMYHVASSLSAVTASMSASKRASTELNVLRIAAEGAKVGNANLVDVTNALDAAVVSGIKGVHNYSQAMGGLNSIVGAGDMNMQDLADVMGTGVLANSQVAGVSLTSLGGALAVLGDNNMRGAKAGTILSSTLRVMKAPSEAAAGALKMVNLSSTQLADDLRTGGILKALDDLKAHLAASGATADQQGGDRDPRLRWQAGKRDQHLDQSPWSAQRQDRTSWPRLGQIWIRLGCDSADDGLQDPAA